MDYNRVQCDATEKLISKRSSHKKYVEVLTGRYVPQMNLLAKYVNKNDPILDVGIREGWFLEFLRNMGYTNLFGIDIYSKSVKLARLRGLKAEVLDIQQDKLDKKFKAVVMSHVFEHVQRPLVALKNVNDMLVKGGIVLVEVPRESHKKQGVNASHFMRFHSMEYLKKFFNERWKIEKEIKVGEILRVVARKK